MNDTKTKQLFLSIIKNAIQNNSNDLSQIITEDIPPLLELALAHKLLPVVVDQLHDCEAAVTWSGFASYKRTSRMQVMQQVQREQEFLDVYAALKEAGLRTLVLKGCVCRAVWPKGDLRPSGDEDLFVRPEEYDAACDVLERCGLAWDGRESPHMVYETGWRKPNSSLYIELHQRLFSPVYAAMNGLQEITDSAFDRVMEYNVTRGSARVWSMAPQDHLIYLLLHAYTHFIHSGVGIRQVCDIGLWAQTYSNVIDWNGVYRSLTQVELQYFSAAILGIVENELGIELELSESWHALAVDRLPMLDDIMNAGVFGGASSGRGYSGILTLEAANAGRGSRRKHSLLRQAFPPIEKMAWKYPELREHPALLPVAWMKRLLRYRRETKEDENYSASNSVRVAKKREKLLKQYHII